MMRAAKTKKALLESCPRAGAELTCDRQALGARLLAWYDVHRRTLPWRAPKGAQSEAYRVWLSEIMLQQTTVKAVESYYRKFLKNWPDVIALAHAKPDDVLAAWAGLGYYARARNLHAAAQMVATQFGGKFPETAQALRSLPGIGRYTAGAIAAIVHDEKQPAMDANAERVIARLYGVKIPLPKAKNVLYDLCQDLIPDRAGDFAQALMDLGAMICTPKKPGCLTCPWSKACVAHQHGVEDRLPVKPGRSLRPLKRGAAFVVKDARNSILLVRRPQQGLLARMLQPPLSPWGREFLPVAETLEYAPIAAVWRKRAGLVRHSFTHFELEMEVYCADVAKRPKSLRLYWPSDAAPAAPHTGRVVQSRQRASQGQRRSGLNSDAIFWVAQDALAHVPLPTVMRKILELGLGSGL